MEKRGIYRKGSAGHVKNMNSYNFYRQNMKKWRVPLTGLVALLLVFGIAPLVGEEFQASLLTSNEQEIVASAKPETVQKIMLSALNDFIKDCEAFRIVECVDDGKALTSAIIASPKESVSKFVGVVEEFALTYETKLALSVCKFDVGDLFVETRKSRESFQDFAEEYGDVIDSSDVSSAGNALASAEQLLYRLSKYCSDQQAED